MPQDGSVYSKSENWCTPKYVQAVREAFNCSIFNEITHFHL